MCLLAYQNVHWCESNPAAGCIYPHHKYRLRFRKLLTGVPDIENGQVPVEAELQYQYRDDDKE
mgnify:CR=1 FL=1